MGIQILRRFDVLKGGKVWMILPGFKPTNIIFCPVAERVEHYKNKKNPSPLLDRICFLLVATPNC